jgi:ParB family chromosome partitioning protein
MDLVGLLKNQLAMEAQVRMKAGVKLDPSPKSDEGMRTDAALAELAGVGKTKFREYEKVKATGTPELLQAVRADQVSVHRAAEIAKLPANEQAARIPHVANNSGNNEWYTPEKFIEAARRAMGSIDTDPASCEFANLTVKATTFYTAEQDGLKQVWTGNVWMNPPYAAPLIGQFAEAVASKYSTGEINQAIVLVNNATETEWFGTLSDEVAAVCFPRTRIKFIAPDGSPTGCPLQGQAILYFGPRVAEFSEAFTEFGPVLVPVEAAA